MSNRLRLAACAPALLAAVYANSQTPQPQYSDTPSFVVAGVTDAAQPGVHGSDAVVRSAEALAKATSSLSSKLASGDYARVRAEARDLLTKWDKPELHHMLAEADEKLGDPLEAVHEYQRAAELDPSEANLFDWGSELLGHRAFAPAVEVFTRGKVLFPRSSRLLLGLASALYAQGSYEKAAPDFFAACDLNPSDPAPYLFLGKAQAAEISQSAGFAERMARFAKLHPENALAKYYYAKDLWGRRLGKQDTQTALRVRALLQDSIRLDSKLDVAYLQLGIVYAEQGDPRRAIPILLKAVHANPKLEEAHYRLAQAYARVGDAMKAHRELTLRDELAKQTAQQTAEDRAVVRQFVVGPAPQ
jgi:tetratricopeptide (TPR) repeat protein